MSDHVPSPAIPIKAIIAMIGATANYWAIESLNIESGLLMGISGQESKFLETTQVRLTKNVVNAPTANADEHILVPGSAYTKISRSILSSSD